MQFPFRKFISCVSLVFVVACGRTGYLSDASVVSPDAALDSAADRSSTDSDTRVGVDATSGEDRAVFLDGAPEVDAQSASTDVRATQDTGGDAAAEDAGRPPDVSRLDATPETGSAPADAFADARDSVARRSVAPWVAYTDLTSGPNRFGLNDQGTVLRIIGERFGDSRGASTVTIGGGEVGAYLFWGDDIIVVSIGSAAITGRVVVTTASGASTQNVNFTVRPGAIRCVAGTGSDLATGVWDACWRTLPHALSAAQPGDIIYDIDVAEISGAAIGTVANGTPAEPIALVGWVGPSLQRIRRSLGLTLGDHWVVAGFDIESASRSLQFGAHGRAVANVIRCIDAVDNCITFTGGNAVLLGNQVGQTASSTPYFAVFFDRNTSVLVGRNYFTQNQITSVGIAEADSVYVHSNAFSNDECGSIVLEGVGGTTTFIYNNLFSLAEGGPTALARCSSRAIVAASDTAPERTRGVINFEFNTVARSGPHLPAEAAFVNSSPHVIRLFASVLAFGPSDRLLLPGADVVGDGCLLAAPFPAPSSFIGTIEADPELGPDYEPLPSSPTRNAAPNAPGTVDIVGYPRDLDGRSDIGAVEHVE